MKPTPYIQHYCCSPKEDEQTGWSCGKCGAWFRIDQLLQATACCSGYATIPYKVTPRPPKAPNLEEK